MRTSHRSRARRAARSARRGRGRCTRSRCGRTRTTASPGSICFTLSHWPAIEPTTTTSSAPNSTLTPRRWKLRLAPPTAGRDVEARREPGGRDPEDAELRVPGPRDRVRQDRRERDAVEAVALDAVVRGDDADHDLQQRQSATTPEVLHRRALRRRRRRRRAADPSAGAGGQRLAAPASRARTPARRCRRAAG